MESSASSATRSGDPPLDNITLLGILSDTHDRPDVARAGIQTLRAAGAQYLIHCGDVGGEQILDLLAGIPTTFVWGNNDYDRKSLTTYARDLGLHCAGDFAELQIANKEIAVTHGDNPKLIERATNPENHFDYLFLGHTHIPAHQRLSDLQIINPGALHRAARKSVALLDLKSDALRHITVRI
jgi:putative phosphoesterase